MSTGYIYLLYNTETDRYYVGQTTYSVAKRWQEHVATARTKYHTHLYHSVNHHGPDAFEVSVLQEVSADDDAALRIRLNDLEKLWIVMLGSYDEAVGYNMTYGGEGGTPTEAVRKKIGKGNRGRKWTPEQREKAKRTKSLKPHPNKGMKLSPERIAQLTAARLAKPISPETRRKWSDAGKRQKQSVETRRKRSEACKGAGNPMFGKHWKIGPDGQHLSA
jgi:group I intron endonuclease